jgi:hypothetical protein
MVGDRRRAPVRGSEFNPQPELHLNLNAAKKNTLRDGGNAGIRLGAGTSSTSSTTVR